MVLFCTPSSPSYIPPSSPILSLLDQGPSSPAFVVTRQDFPFVGSATTATAPTMSTSRGGRRGNRVECPTCPAYPTGTSISTRPDRGVAHCCEYPVWFMGALIHTMAALFNLGWATSLSAILQISLGTAPC
eukprot:TRINITY_DN3089_c4_g1_i5.p2 TRINITY_DN3089_c4_g1~~TRINITY_DN3089_c4_g1_i5.p2  ORF type:complete len:131 (+),score=13.70 TRINITY_DN3089_c4_g1_i5:141-533(+)